MTKINFIYTKGLGFFAEIKEMRSIINQKKSEDSYSKFTPEADEFEIGRGDSYAVFKELKNGDQLTLSNFRHSLEAHGIKDPLFQDKILNMILQNKAGIPFKIGSLINKLLIENECFLAMNPDYQVKLKVTKNKKINLIFKAAWEDPAVDPREPAIDARVKINIAEDRVAITSFEFTKLSDSPKAKEVFDFLKANQQNIIMKLITLIKHLLGFNNELVLEKEQDSPAPTSSMV